MSLYDGRRDNSSCYQCNFCALQLSYAQKRLAVFYCLLLCVFLAPAHQLHLKDANYKRDNSLGSRLESLFARGNPPNNNQKPPGQTGNEAHLLNAAAPASISSKSFSKAVRLRRELGSSQMLATSVDFPVLIVDISVWTPRTWQNILAAAQNLSTNVAIRLSNITAHVISIPNDALLSITDSTTYLPYSDSINLDLASSSLYSVQSSSGNNWLLLMYYNLNLFDKYQLSVPSTWVELLHLASQWNGTDFNGDGVLDFSLALDMTEGCKSHYILAGIVAPLLQYRGSSQGMYFDPSDLSPLLDGNPAFLSALDTFHQLASFSPPPSSSCTETDEAFTNGRALITINFFQIRASVEGSAAYNNTGVAPLPGSDSVLDRTSGTLVTCNPHICPYAKPLTISTTSSSATSGSSTVWVNQAPILGSGQVVISVYSSNETGIKEFELGAEFAYDIETQPADVAWNAALTASFKTYDTAPLVSAGFSPSDAEAYLSQYSTWLTFANVVPDLSLPNSAVIRQYIARAASSIIGNTVPYDETAPRLGGDLNATLSTIRALNPALDLLALYRTSINLKASSPPPPPASFTPSSNHIVLITCATLGSVFALAIVAAVAIYLCFWGQIRGPSLKGHAAPSCGPSTTLVVTDIQNSTTLWEALDSTDMDRALALHHKCIRRFLLQNRGYESATEGDAFILAFHSPGDAVAFAVATQAALINLAWPPELLLHPDGEEIKVTVTHHYMSRLSSITQAMIASASTGFKLSQLVSMGRLSSSTSSRGVYPMGPKRSLSFLTRANHNPGDQSIRSGARRTRAWIDADVSTYGGQAYGTRSANARSLMEADVSTYNGRALNYSGPSLEPEVSSLNARGVPQTRQNMDNDMSTYGGQQYGTRMNGQSRGTADLESPTEQTMQATVTSATLLEALQCAWARTTERHAMRTVTVFRGLKVRMGLHCGLDQSSLVDSNSGGRSSRLQFCGTAISSAKALCDTCVGGMILLDDAALSYLSIEKLTSVLWLVHMGEHILKDHRQHQVYQILGCGLAPRIGFFSPLRSEEKISAGIIDAPVGLITVVFINVEGVDELLEWNSEITRSALSMFHKLATSEASRHGGYIAELVGGLCLATFSSTADAVLWGLAVVENARQINWPRELLDHPLCSERPASGSGAGALSSTHRSREDSEDISRIRLTQPQPIRSPNGTSSPFIGNHSVPGGRSQDFSTSRLGPLYEGMSAPVGAPGGNVQAIQPTPFLHMSQSFAGSENLQRPFLNTERSRQCSPVPSGSVQLPLAPEGITFPPRLSTGNSGHRGLKLKVGIATGPASDWLHLTSGKVTYRGKVMNRAARIAAGAMHGQVLVSSNAWEACSADMERSNVVGISLGTYTFKGIRDKIEVVLCTRPSLLASMPLNSGLSPARNNGLPSPSFRQGGRQSQMFSSIPLNLGFGRALDSINGGLSFAVGFSSSLEFQAIPECSTELSGTHSRKESAKIENRGSTPMSVQVGFQIPASAGSSPVSPPSDQRNSYPLISGHPAGKLHIGRDSPSASPDGISLHIMKPNSSLRDESSMEEPPYLHEILGRSSPQEELTYHKSSSMRHSARASQKMERYPTVGEVAISDLSDPGAMRTLSQMELVKFRSTNGRIEGQGRPLSAEVQVARILRGDRSLTPVRENGISMEGNEVDDLRGITTIIDISSSPAKALDAKHVLSMEEPPSPYLNGEPDLAEVKSGGMSFEWRSLLSSSPRSSTVLDDRELHSSDQISPLESVLAPVKRPLVWKTVSMNASFAVGSENSAVH